VETGDLVGHGLARGGDQQLSARTIEDAGHTEIHDRALPEVLDEAGRHPGRILNHQRAVDAEVIAPK
jgi:hypothetical protein